MRNGSGICVSGDMLIARIERVISIFVFMKRRKMKESSTLNSKEKQCKVLGPLLSGRITVH
jgi:hypothetical protein